MATRIDAIGTIFGDWTVAPDTPVAARGGRDVRPPAVHAGSDMPIEKLQVGVRTAVRTYDAIFSGFSADERAMLFHRTAQRWYASRPLTTGKP